MRDTGTRIFLPLLGVLLFCGSVVAALAEIEPYLKMRGSIAERHEVLRDRAVRSGFSTETKFFLLDQCIEVSSSPINLLQHADEQAALLSACSDLAEATSLEVPGSSIVWLSRARLYALQADNRFLDMLRNARKTGPNVHWLAAERLMLAEQYYDRLDADDRQGERFDIAALTGSTAGLRALAEIYEGRPSSRERILATVEEANLIVQREFLHHLAAVRRGE